MDTHVVAHKTAVSAVTCLHDFWSGVALHCKLAKRTAGLSVPDFLKELRVDIAKIHFWSAANTGKYVTIQSDASMEPINITWNMVQNKFPDPISEPDSIDIVS